MPQLALPDPDVFVRTEPTRTATASPFPSRPHQPQVQSSWYNLVAQEETNTCESQPWKPIGFHSGDFCDKGNLVLQLSWAWGGGGGGEKKERRKITQGLLG